MVLIKFRLLQVSFSKENLKNCLFFSRIQMEELEIKLNLGEIKPELRKILEKININVVLEYSLTDTEFVLRDDYVVHKNEKYAEIPLRIPIKNQ